MLRAVLGPTADVGLDDVAAVEEGHLAVGLNPDLVARVLREDGEGRDVEAELARLGELACFSIQELVLAMGSADWEGARRLWSRGGEGPVELTETHPHGYELLSGYRRRDVRDRQANVVHPVLVKPEDEAVSVGPVAQRRDEVLERRAGVVRQLGEQRLCLLLC